MIDPKLQTELRTRFNPDGSQLRQIQLRMLEMLKYIDRICREHDIPYWLSSGTCLGAVRHGGFIPWDDDVDVEMLGKDYDRFVKIVMADTTSPYVMQTRTTDPSYRLKFGKLRDTRTEIVETNSYTNIYRYNGLYIDIFPMEPSNSRFICKIIAWCFFHASDGYDQFNPIERRQGLSLKLKKIRYEVINRCIIVPLSLINRIGSKNRLRHSNPAGFFWARDHRDLFPLSQICFENVILNVPGNVDGYLSKIYGDYMRLPDIDKITFHTTDFKVI